MVVLSICVLIVEAIAIAMVLGEYGKDKTYWTFGKQMIGMTPYIAGLVLAIAVLGNALFTR
jgi:hypothetical protein